MLDEARERGLVRRGDGDVGARAVVLEMGLRDEGGLGEEDGGGPEGAGDVGAEGLEVGC